MPAGEQLALGGVAGHRERLLVRDPGLRMAAASLADVASHGELTDVLDS